MTAFTPGRQVPSSAKIRQDLRRALACGRDRAAAHPELVEELRLMRQQEDAQRAVRHASNLAAVSRLAAAHAALLRGHGGWRLSPGLAWDHRGRWLGFGWHYRVVRVEARHYLPFFGGVGWGRRRIIHAWRREPDDETLLHDTGFYRSGVVETFLGRRAGEHAQVVKPVDTPS